jgi:hypothetical protein
MREAFLHSLTGRMPKHFAPAAPPGWSRSSSSIDVFARV